MADLSVSLGKLRLSNPVLVASGTFGYGEDYQDLVSLKRLGALVTKTITLKKREGNPAPRIVETYQGMLNSIGLENPGFKGFVETQLPFMRKIGIPVIVSISADKAVQFARLARALSRTAGVAAIELNISCPNLGKKGLIAQDARSVYKVVKATRRATKLPIITKLSPNVTDIGAIAKAAGKGGSDIISLVNTYFAMAVDVQTRTPKLGSISGGLSGPAIKPQALWMVRQAYKAVKIPIIGMGGIMNAQDALEFIVCGASAIAVGTATFVDPQSATKIIAGIESYLEEKRIPNLKKVIGSLKDGK
ncbi:MAG: dihydroorotate dehydrogenase [Candidatus Omnitrophica bacterium]|nr:dihydroorotate dehydrogenase [Candidatus Omnitrophota bacterium]